MALWDRVFRRFGGGSQVTKESVRDAAASAIPERPAPRLGGNAAPVSALLEPTVPVAHSEMQLTAQSGSAYAFGADMGRLAASGKLVANLHPRHLAFDGERFVLTDWGQVFEVEVKAAAFLPWLAELRGTWGEGFGGFFAGFAQGLRAAVATAHPELGRELMAAIGGKLSPHESAWPLREELARVLGTIKTGAGGSNSVADLSVLQETATDVDERTALSILASMLGADLSSLMTGPVTLKCDVGRLAAALAQLNTSRDHQRQLWLAVFFITHLGNLVCDSGNVLDGISLLQTGQLLLQHGVAAPAYFESALACCIHRESDRIGRPSRRCPRDEVFSALAYSNSRALTCAKMFQASVKLVDGGRATNAMWTAIHAALDRVRACETAFSPWAANDLSAYIGAAPALQMLARTHMASVLTLVDGLKWAAGKSMSLPWLLSLDRLLPKLQKEVEWCRSIVEIDAKAPSLGPVLQERFGAVSSIVGKGPFGVNRISFLPPRS